MANYKYVKREWKNGRWQYVYPEDMKTGNTKGSTASNAEVKRGKSGIEINVPADAPKNKFQQIMRNVEDKLGFDERKAVKKEQSESNIARQQAELFKEDRDKVMRETSLNLGYAENDLKTKSLNRSINAQAQLIGDRKTRKNAEKRQEQIEAEYQKALAERDSIQAKRDEASSKYERSAALAKKEADEYQAALEEFHKTPLGKLDKATKKGQQILRKLFGR